MRKEVTPEGYQTLSVDDYGPYFQEHGVELVVMFPLFHFLKLSVDSGQVRLNKKYYDEKKFQKYGIRHLELYYLDGSNPPAKILNRFLEACEATPGAIAVHCKAGLGRTGTCIGAYMMKHYRMTAPEVIGWMRICRPGR